MDVWQQLLDVRAHGCRAAGDGDVGVERWLRVGDRGLLGHADSPNGAACAGLAPGVEGLLGGAEGRNRKRP